MSELSVASVPTMSFSEMNLPAELKKSLEAMKFQTPTPIQEQSIPQILLGHDIMGEAQTGTGKTGAFGIPLIASLFEDEKRLGLILVPTRELATQVAEVITQLAGKKARFIPAVLIGGSSMTMQLRAISRGPRVVVATPGRLMDHLRRGSIHLDQVSMLVLDEADRMLDMGFAPQLEEILEFLPENRQTLLFSATFPSDIEKLAKKYLKDPKKISMGKGTQPAPLIKTEVIPMLHSEKNNQLLEHINARTGSVLIFARTKIRTDRVADYLKDYGLSVSCIHGGRSQAQRDAALRDFRKGKNRILVATDIAARGLDVPHIAHVINYDLPQTAEDYIHRIGRTARAGAEGEAISFLAPEEKDQWRQIIKLCYPKNPEMHGGVSTSSSSYGSRGGSGKSGRSGGGYGRKSGGGGGFGSRKPAGKSNSFYNRGAPKAKGNVT